MCGRARLSSDVSEIKLVFSIPPHRPTPNIAPSWNVDALLKEAEVAVTHFVEPGNRADTLRLLRLDRNLLELYAVHGRNIANYTAAKKRYGVT